jgi:hypothetical protein
MTDLERNVREIAGTVQETAQQGWQQAKRMATGEPEPSGFSKAAGEALEYIRKMLENGAELASTAFNGAVEMGKGAYDNISQTTQRGNNNNDRGGPTPGSR